MEPSNQSGTVRPNRSRTVLIAALVVAILAVAAVVFWTQSQKTEEPEKPKIGYATEGVTAIDEGSLQDAVNDLMEKTEDGYISLIFQNDAFSTDGATFSCNIGNDEKNAYDMFIAIYSDSEFTDELFVSELLRPGTTFQSVTLEKPLEKGDHTVYVVFTQVEEDLETIHAQVPVTINFHVT